MKTRNSVIFALLAGMGMRAQATLAIAPAYHIRTEDGAFGRSAATSACRSRRVGPSAMRGSRQGAQGARRLAVSTWGYLCVQRSIK
jgi:hypothetical protein